MQRNYTFLMLLSIFIVTCAAYGIFVIFKVASLPVQINIVDAHTANIEPIKGIPLPAGIQPGDRMQLATQPPRTRAVIGINTLSAYLAASLPLGHTYDFVIQRGNVQVAVPVTSVNLSQASGIPVIQWIYSLQELVFAGLALLIVWRGHNRAAAGMALWTIGNMAGGAAIFPLDGLAGVAMVATANFGYVLARVGFYVLADAIARPILSSRMRRLYLIAFTLILTAGSMLFSLGGPFLYAFTGWAGGLLPHAGLLWSAGYLVPVILLFSAYQYASVTQRLRLRWMLWSGVIFLLGVVASNTPILTVQFSVGFTDTCQLIGVIGFLYAVLRHRVVDVSVLLDRTLVYGAITALVVGILAAVNSLVQHAALGTNASLLLQVAVPLALGIVLTRLRTYLDKIVERVFFRKRYLAYKALRRFAQICDSFEQADELMVTAIAEIRQHLGARGLAIYERRDDHYIRVCHEGDVHYPTQIKIDDTAFVAARADQNDIDLSELHSSLGTDGYAFPMTAHGEMQYALVCGNRPGEHYPADDRQLLAQLALEMGMALYALRMRAQSQVMEALARATPVTFAEIQTQARALLSTAAAS